MSYLNKKINTRKGYLIAGAIVFLICLCIVYPIQRSYNITIEDFGFTYFTLAIALLLTMYGLMGGKFVKGLLFLILSALVSFCLWYIFCPEDIFSTLLAIWLGIPSGLLAGILCLILNHFFLKDQKPYQRLLIQAVSYAVVLFVISVLFYKGGDLMEKLAEYL